MGEVSLSKVMEELASEAPDRPALTCDGQTLSRMELDLTSNRLARVYGELGVVEDDLVTLALPNSIDFVVACLAIWKCGATPQPVSHALPDAELGKIIELANPRIVVGVDEDRSFGRPFLPRGFEAPPEVSDAALPEKTAACWKAPTSGGSTGRPKLILATSPATLDTKTAFAQGQVRDGVSLVPGPMYHNGPFACAMRAMFIGNHVVLCSRFDPEATLSLIERERVDWTLLVPTMMSRIWRLPESTRNKYDLSSLRYCLHFGAPCPVWLKEAWIAWLGPDRIFELFGPSEAQGATRINGHEWLAHPGSVGRPIDGCEVKVFDSEGVESPPGVVGEIYMRSSTGKVTYRYLGAEAETLPGGWETVGDLGWVDEDGYLFFADRRTDMIVTGGSNVYPAEIEAALESHPSVKDSAVIGLPDDDKGQRLHAIVQLEPEVSDDELREHLRNHLVHYKIPSTFEHVAHSVRDEGGKVRRSGLRAERLPSA